MSEIRIETRVDCERGCGWRKAGGKYLVGGSLCAPCAKLPLKLDVCPCCTRGIKPSRGWTWIGAWTLFWHDDGGSPCGPECGYGTCPLWDPPGRAGLLWIGGQFYTPDAFTREAARLGISRRIAQIPKEFKVGETLVLLAHREIEFAWGEKPWPGIFAAFIPTAIEYVIRGDETPAELERLQRQGCTLVEVKRSVQDDTGKAGSLSQYDLAESADLRPANAERAFDRAGDGEGKPESVPQVPAARGPGIVAPGDPTGTETGPATQAL